MTACMNQVLTCGAWCRCNLGVVTPFQSGRIDAKTANPPGQLPAPFGEPHVSVVASFYRMGFNLKEFVALLFGSHSTAFLQVSGQHQYARP